MTIDQESKNQFNGFFSDWKDASERRSQVTEQMNESVEGAAESIGVDKKTARKMFRVLDKMNIQEEYNLINLCESVVEKK